MSTGGGAMIKRANQKGNIRYFEYSLFYFNLRRRLVARGSPSPQDQREIRTAPSWMQVQASHHRSSAYPPMIRYRPSSNTTSSYSSSSAARAARSFA